MKHLSSLLLLFSFVTFSASAQYNGGESAIGVRLGSTAGLSYKKFFGKTFAMEALLVNSFEKKEDGMVLGVLFQKHAPLAGNRFSALIGGGGSYDFARKSAGLNGIIGFDWRILRSPLNLQVDWLPGWYFKGEDAFRTGNAAFTVRYTLNRGKVYAE